MANFVKHTSCESCGSKDNFALYKDDSGHESGHCFGCGYTIPSKEYIDSQNKVSSFKRKELKNVSIENKEKPSSVTKPSITEDEHSKIKENTVATGKGFRYIRDETYKYFGVRHKFEDDEIKEQYYPVTSAGELVGYKIREVPKNFRSVARTGADCDLFMSFRFNRGGKYVVITEGEVCALSAYQMLKDYNVKRGSDFEIAVVSPTTGANSQKQIANAYKFLDSFDFIVLAMDSDDAGKKATEKIIPVLPKGKVKVMQMRYKDHNEYLENGKEKEYVSDFYAAKTYVPVGVLSSGNIYDRMLQQAAVARVPFPPFMHKLNEMFVGGMPLGHIFNIAADTGSGKTTYINEMIYYWIFHSPHLVGIVSMELDAGQYGEALVSRHLSRKLSLIGNLDEKMNYLKSESVKDKISELMLDSEGKDRFYLLDNRDGSVEEIQDTIEELVVACGCKIIVLDPLQDVLDGLSNEEQSVFMKWAKGFIKSHGISFVFINHMRKSENSTEQDIMGSSTIIKSASANIILKRDKLAEDEIVRNTTTVTVAKNRICGITGPAGAAYYDNQTHTLYDLDEFLNGRL